MGKEAIKTIHKNIDAFMTKRNIFCKECKKK